MSDATLLAKLADKDAEIARLKEECQQLTTKLEKVWGEQMVLEENIEVSTCRLADERDAAFSDLAIAKQALTAALAAATDADTRNAELMRQLAEAKARIPISPTAGTAIQSFGEEVIADLQRHLLESAALAERMRAALDEMGSFLDSRCCCHAEPDDTSCDYCLTRAAASKLRDEALARAPSAALREHDLATANEIAPIIRAAKSDPGAFTTRGDNYTESLGSWERRALKIAIERHFSETRRALVDGREGGVR